MDELSRFCCQNQECRDYGQRGGGNLSVCDRYGPNKERRLFYCKTCKARFSERRGTPLFGALLSEEKLIAVLAHIAEGCGVRKTSRLTGVNKNTVVRYSRLAGEHAKALHDELVAFSPSDPGGPVRRKVELRRQERETLRTRQPGRRSARR
jgi:LacI family transcriptional regulator